MGIKSFFRNLKHKLVPPPKPVIPTPKTVIQTQPTQKAKPEMLLASRKERRKKRHDTSALLRAFKNKGERVTAIQPGDASMLLVKDPHERVVWLKKNFVRIVTNYSAHTRKKIIALCAVGLNRKQLRAYKISVRPKTLRIRAGLA